MAAPRFDVGTTVRLRVEWEDTETGDPVDPTDVTCRIRPPSGVETHPGVSHPSTGIFTANVQIDAEGWWHGRFEADEAAVEFRFGGKETAFDGS